MVCEAIGGAQGWHDVTSVFERSVRLQCGKSQYDDVSRNQAVVRIQMREGPGSSGGTW